MNWMIGDNMGFVLSPLRQHNMPESQRGFGFVLMARNGTYCRAAKRETHDYALPNRMLGLTAASNDTNSQ
jgi:hypothetical protein